MAIDSTSRRGALAEHETGEPVRPPRPGAEALIIVGIGASAGGLEALATMLANLELDNSAFIVVQHLSPDHDSMLGELLARTTKLTVATITDGLEVAANHVYVIPPNHDLAILHGVLHLMTPPTARGARLPIDYFFRSLAADQGESAVGVILSGTGTDGTFGLKAIKAEGGMTFVQDPQTAKYDGMPRSALDSGHADICLPPDALGQELSRLARKPHLLKLVATGRAQTQEQLAKIFVLIRREFGNDLTHYKHSTIERRIERRMALHKIERLADYVDYVQSNPAELAILYKDILISVTTFFRDAAVFESLKTDVFPRILGHKKPGDPIRIWTAGCSTGEESYSLAISLLEFLGDRAVDYKIQLFGTDVDAGSIQHARRGFYPQNISLDVTPERLHRFFRRQDNELCVSRAVRDLVVFATQNLTKDAPFSHVDLVTCRNVLIYLQPVLQKKVLRILHYALDPGGFLLLGTSETVGDSPDLFALADRKNKLYTKKNITSPATFELAASVSPDTRGALVTPPLRELRPVPTMQQLADRRLLDRYAPPGVLINEALEILQYRGRTGAYLEPTPGTASLHLLKNARPELQSELRTLIQRARAENATATGSPVPLRNKETGELGSVTVDVIPVQDAAGRSNCLLVVFRESEGPRGDTRDADASASARARARDEERAASPSGAQQLRDVERELVATKEYLQTTIEELETANEELQSSNEELQSSNEELQSTNEELETSKEELQSSNEELTTVNDELQNRMTELGQSNDDLSNVLTGVDVAVVIVGADTRIRRFSGRAETLLNLVAGDVGRSISHLASQVKNGDVGRIVEEVIRRVITLQKTVMIGDAWFTLRVAPYMTAVHSIRGAMLLFLEVDGGRTSLDHALVAAESAGAILVAIKHPLLILDENLAVIWANAAFYETFETTVASTMGQVISRVGRRPWAHPKLVELLEQTAATGLPFKNFSLTYEFTTTGRRTMNVEGSVIPSPGSQDGAKGGTKLILVVIEEKKPAKALAKRSTKKLTKKVATKLTKKRPKAAPKKARPKVRSRS